MTAEGLPSSRPLIRWMRSIAAGVERVAGEAVEAVGGEDGDAAARRSALQRRARRRRAVALDRDDLAHRPPTTTRSIPARSAAISISREAGLAQQLGHLERLALAPTSQRRPSGVGGRHVGRRTTDARQRRSRAR